MNELNTLAEQTLEEFLFDVSSVGKYLPIENFAKYRPYPTVPVIYVCTCKTERYHFTGIIAEQMQLEPMTPTHGTLSVLGKTGKDLVEMTSYIMTYRNHRAVNERYACTPAEGMELHEQHHLEEHTGHEFHKTVIGHGSREFMSEPPTDTVLIILFEITICTEVIAYKDCHYFTLRKSSLTVPTTFSIAVIRW
ncbi:hypothetical protein JCM15124A_22000 [Prevotella falsenii]